MSLLSQFFGGGGGESGIDARVLIVDGGKGRSCKVASPCCTPCYCIAGEGGRVYELNVYLNPGSVCPVTVGSGGTAFFRNICVAGSLVPTPYGNCCTGNTCWIMGNYGELSGFSDLVASCIIPVCCTPVGFCYRPVSNSANFCGNLLAYSEKQNVPFNTYNNLTNKGSVLEECTTISGVAAPPTCDPIGAYGCGCYARSGFYDPSSMGSLADYRVYNAAINNSKYCFCPGTIVPCAYPCTYPTCYDVSPIAVSSQYGRGSGYVSDITGCVCVYGAGGIGGPAVTPVVRCRCDVTYTGSGAGAPIGTGTSTGCPGIVVIQYPADYAAATTSSPNVCDCSPLTPGSRTYKFYCPGTITLP